MASTADRVREHRGRLRAQGLRPVQLWLPDTSAPAFAAEAARQTHLLAQADQAEGSLEWLDEVNIWPAES